MGEVPSELRDEIPSFEEEPVGHEHGPIDWSALTSIRTAKTALEFGAIFAVAVAVFFGAEGILRVTHTQNYVFPKPISVVKALFVHDFWLLYGHHLWITLQEFLIGLAIGSTVGLVLAAVITQKPFVEKIVAPYIIVLVTTPMLALVPFIRVATRSFSIWPIVIAVALASGPMVLINAATGFRRTDLAKIALARSYGASTF